MVPFKKMWEDALTLISENELEDISIVESYKGGFVVKEKNDTEFINKEDFVDFWCKMLYNREVAKDEAIQGRKSRYIYQIIRNLPYVDESCNVLKLVD